MTLFNPRQSPTLTFYALGVHDRRRELGRNTQPTAGWVPEG